MKDFRVLMHIKTISNSKGVCAINSVSDKPILATLAETKGQIQLHNFYLKKTSTIQAYPLTSVVCIALNNSVMRDRWVFWIYFLLGNQNGCD